MLGWLRLFLFVAVIRPVAVLLIGMDVFGKENLPSNGPAIIAANHNSHIDTLLLLSLFPARMIERVRPVAAADHFLGSPFSRWFFLIVVGILPIDRGRQSARKSIKQCASALAEGNILILFPEGTRGTAEVISDFKAGIAVLAEGSPATPVIPVYLQGAGRVLPRGAAIPVPFTCSAIVGEAFSWSEDRARFMERLRLAIEALKADAPPLRWI